MTKWHLATRPRLPVLRDRPPFELPGTKHCRKTMT